MGEFLIDQWTIITEHALVFIVFGIIIASGAVAITNKINSGALEIARERLSAAKEDIERLQGQKYELIKRLDSYGEDIEKLRTELDSRPRIHISKDPPEDKNALWLQISEEDKE